MTETADPRPGSSQDLSRRMDKMEQNHEQLVKDVGSLAGTVARVELNQAHAEELNKLRFDGLAQGIATVDGKVVTVTTKIDAFISRVEGIITGEVRTAQTAQGEKIIADYNIWHDKVEARLDAQDELSTQVRFLGRLVLVATGGGIVSIIAALIAAAIAISNAKPV